MKKYTVEKQTTEMKVPTMFQPIFEQVPGMENLKRALVNLYHMQQVNKKRFTLGVGGSDHGYKNNLLIVGPSGSGKTTAAELVGECYKKLGLVSDSTPIMTDYQALLSTSASETAENVKKLMESAVDRIILMDHVEDFDDNIAYSPGFEMLDQIVEAYYGAEGTITILAAGEEKAVKDLLHKKRNFAALFEIPEVVVGEYSEEELSQVVKRIAGELGYVLDEGVDQILLREYQNQKNTPDFHYLNLFKDMIVEASMNAASRVAKIRRASELDVSLILAEDFRPVGTASEETENLDELLRQLDGLIGLGSVKEQVRAMIASVKMSRLEEKAGINTSRGTLHMVFSGAPGTGKTTVARLVGKIYARLGVLSKGQMIECSRNDLVADVVGGTAPKTHAKIEEARGDVLFIDEAYSVCRDKNDIYGLEAVNTLTADIYNYRDDLLVILAGYDREMDDFLSQNPGMKSRVPNVIHFEDYSTDELMCIFQKYVEDSGMFLHPDAEGDARRLLEEKARGMDFGNARGVENVFHEVVRNHQKRLSALKEEFVSINDVKIIRKEDLLDSSEQSQKRKTIQDWYTELDSLTGLQAVKEQVRQMAAKVQVNQLKKDRGLPTTGLPSLHLIFEGNAGTGKTTVARLIGNIYKELGILSTGKLVECTRSDIVGEYQGQTAQKMKAKIKEAQGGILFLDEVYSLCNGPYDSYGMEAINELVPAMENQRDSLMVIVAGYPDKMETFLNRNQGLKSRFSRELFFEDYSWSELLTIFQQMLKAQALALKKDEEVQQLVEDILLTCYVRENFGNARGVRNLVETLSQLQECRIAGLLEKGEEISDEELQQITGEDLLELQKTL